MCSKELFNIITIGVFVVENAFDLAYSRMFERRRKKKTIFVWLHFDIVFGNPIYILFSSSAKNYSNQLSIWKRKF